MVVHVHHHIMFLLQVPPSLPAVYPKFFIATFSSFYKGLPGNISWREVNKELFSDATGKCLVSLLSLCDGAHCRLRLSKTLNCISFEQELHRTMGSLSVFVILSITGPLMSSTIFSWRCLRYITDDFDNSFWSGTVYRSGTTIISKSSRTPLPPERHLIYWNAPFCNFNFGKAFIKACVMHSWLPSFSFIRCFSLNRFFDIKQSIFDLV